MAWSYDGDPSASDLALVRYRIGDTSETGLATLTDEEIAFELDAAGSADAAVLPALDARLRLARNLVSSSSGTERVEAQQLWRQLQALRADLVADGYADPRATAGGGLSVLRQLIHPADADAVEPV